MNEDVRGRSRNVASRRTLVNATWAIAAATVLLAGLGGARAGVSEPYELAPGDHLTITVFDQPDITGSYMVDAGGDLTLPLIGSFAVTRLTPGDLQMALATKFGDGYLQHPIVSVRLAELRPVSVVGDVRNSGRYAFSNGLTVEAALALAGGSVRATNEEAAQRIELLRAKERLSGLVVAELSQRVRRARLEAQFRDETDFPDPAVDPAQADLLGRVAAGEHQILTFDTAALQSQIALLNERIRILELDVEGGAQQASLETDQIANLEDQLKDGKGLLASGLTRKPMVLDLQREISKTQSNLLRITSELARSKSSLAETKLKISDLVTAAHDRVAADLQTVILRLEDLKTAIPLAREDLRLRLEQLPFAAAPDSRPPVVRLTRYSQGVITTTLTQADAVLRPGDILLVGDGSASAAAPDATSSLHLPDAEGLGARTGERPSSDPGPATGGGRLSQR